MRLGSRRVGQMVVLVSVVALSFALYAAAEASLDTIVAVLLTALILVTILAAILG